MLDLNATIADLRLFYWMLFRLNNPTAGKWILRTLGGAAVLYVALHMMPQYIDEYDAMNGTRGTIDIHHCTGHQGRTFQAWSCTGSIRTADGAYLASVTLNVTQDDAPVDGDAVMVSSTHASHAYMPGQASILDLLPGGLLRGGRRTVPLLVVRRKTMARPHSRLGLREPEPDQLEQLARNQQCTRFRSPTVRLPPPPKGSSTGTAGSRRKHCSGDTTRTCLNTLTCARQPASSGSAVNEPSNRTAR